MVRFDPAKHEEVMEKEGCRPMDFTGKVIKGFVFVDLLCGVQHNNSYVA